MAPSQQGRFLHMMEGVLDRLEDGSIDPHVGAVYPLDEARTAVQVAAQSSAVGRVIVVPSRPMSARSRLSVDDDNDQRKTDSLR